jgi:hypothetical protein
MIFSSVLALPLGTFFSIRIGHKPVILSEAKDLEIGCDVRNRDPSLRSG